MLRKVTRRFWIWLAIALIAYTLAGVFYRDDGHVDLEIYRWGLVAATLAPVGFAVVYTTIWRGWMKNNIGVNQVITNAGVIPFAGILAWVFFVDKGRLEPGWLAWAEFGGPWWFAIWLSWRSKQVIESKKQSGEEKE